MKYLSIKSLCYLFLMLSVSPANAVDISKKILQDGQSCIRIQLKQKLLNKRVTIEQAQDILKNIMLHCFSHSPEATKLLKADSDGITSGIFQSNSGSSSITQANTKVFGVGPDLTTGNLYIVTTEALSEAAHQATNNLKKVANIAD